ncbi:MAG: hypothetical protein K0R52_560, partial [Alphaproteobacteria bacterium]|nr:hypothetical protein [Alphaproteobacteria bacterium]
LPLILLHRQQSSSPLQMLDLLKVYQKKIKEGLNGGVENGV